MRTLEYYISCFTNMNCNKKGGQVAPHKAMLLMAVMELVERGYVCHAYVPVDKVVDACFYEMWHKYVRWAPAHTARFCYPFYHMGSEPFWQLIKSKEWVERKRYSSYGSLKANYRGALLEDELYDFMCEPASRDALRRALLDTYVPLWNSHCEDAMAAEDTAATAYGKHEENVKMVA